MSAPRSFFADKEVLMTGWMVKAPPEKKMRKKSGLAKVITFMNCNSPRFTREETSRLAHTKWQRRFFALYKPRGGLHDEYLLEYFTDENCTRRKGNVDLQHCSEIAAFDQSLQEYKIEFVLSLRTMDRQKSRVYFLSCETEKEMNEWVHYLTTVCKMVMRNEEDYSTSEPPMDSHRSLNNSRSHLTDSITGLSPSTPRLPSRAVGGGSSGNLLSAPVPSDSSQSAFSFENNSNGSGHPPTLPARPRQRGDSGAGIYYNSGLSDTPPANRPLPPPGGIYEQQYDTLPNYNHDSGVYQVPPSSDEQYYNMTGWAASDSVYQIPPDPYNQPGPPIPVGPAATASHDYINLKQVSSAGLQPQDDEDSIYKVPPEHPTTPPPPPIPRRTLRQSFVRRNPQQQQQQQQQQQAAAAAPARSQQQSRHNSLHQTPPMMPSEQLMMQQQQQQQAHLQQHRQHHHHQQKSSSAGRAAYPPASPTADQQHEYHNLWTDGAADPGPGPGPDGHAGSAFSEANMPRNINDVPPLLPPLPSRLRHRDPNKQRSCSSSTSSSASTSSSSSRSSQTSSSGGVNPAAHAGGVSPVDEGTLSPVEMRTSAASPSTSSDHVSYIRAEDLVFTAPATNELKRPVSLTEYNELDPLKTKALAHLAVEISRGK